MNKKISLFLTVMLILLLAGTYRTDDIITKSPWIDVRADPYNATGDGVTDDTAALQAAIDAATAYGTVVLPPGTYKFSQLKFYNPIIFTGLGGVAGRWNSTVAGVKLLHDESTNPAIIIGGKSDSVIKEGDYPKITEFLTANANDIMHAWDNAKKGRHIINELNEFAEIADLTRPVLEAEADFLPNLKRLSYLYRIYAHLQCEKGNSEDAVRQLIELDSVFRKLGLNARSLCARLVCLACLDMGLVSANFVVSNPKTSRESVELLTEHFTPLTDEQVYVRNICICEYLFFKNTLDTELSKTGHRSSPMLKRNSTLRVYRNYCDAAIQYAGESGEDKAQQYSIWPSIYLGFMPQVSITGELTPLECWQYKYYNPFGSLFLSILTPALECVVELKTKIKVQDDLFQIVLNKRLGNQVSLKARAYSDEYIIDVEKKKIFSPGPDGQPDTDDDIKLTINPQVLGLLSK